MRVQMSGVPKISALKHSSKTWAAALEKHPGFELALIKKCLWRPRSSLQIMPIYLQHVAVQAGPSFSHGFDLHFPLEFKPAVNYVQCLLSQMILY